MAASQKVLLIFGAGPNIGASVASLFAQNGYKVALAARRLEDAVNDKGQLQVKVDLTEPESISSAFDKVEKQFGPPSVVLYNASIIHWVPKEDPLELSKEDMLQDFAVNTTGVLEAARRAVHGFQQLPQGVTKTFLYTGNCLNTSPLTPNFMSGGIGKSATAHIMAAASKAYAPKGYQFFYVDERYPDGGPAFKVSGPNNAEHMLQLAESQVERPWLQTFVGGKGYVDFSGKSAEK